MLFFQETDKRQYCLWQYEEGQYNKDAENPFENCTMIRQFNLAYEPG